MADQPPLLSKQNSTGIAVAAMQSARPLAIGLAISVAIWLFVPGIIGKYYALILTKIGIFMILAVSLNIVNGMTGQFSIGHAGFMALGGYTAGFITLYGSIFIWGDPSKHGGPFGSGEWLYVFACLMGGIVAALAGLLVGLPALRLRGDYLAIATLGFGEIMRVLLQNTNDTLGTLEKVQNSTWSNWFPPPVGKSLGFTGLPTYTNLFWVFAFLTVTVIAAWRIKQSSIGRAMIAIRENEIAAQAMGVNVTKQKVMAFVLAGFFAGIAGGLFAHLLGTLFSPIEAGFQRSFEIIIMVVLGGLGSISGVMLAAFIVTLLPELLREFNSFNFEPYRLVVFALLLILMMLFRPQGLCGTREIWDMIPWLRKKKTPPQNPPLADTSRKPTGAKA